MIDSQGELDASAAWPAGTLPNRPVRRKAPLTQTKEGTYQPLDSVSFDEDDAALIDRMLTFYPRSEPRLILDATVNGGRFWRGSRRRVVGLDIEPNHRPIVCADNTSMPFPDGTFDVVVYDPPHIPNQGRDKLKDFNTRFGLGSRSAKENGYSFAHTYPKRGASCPTRVFCFARSQVTYTTTVTNRHILSSLSPRER